MLLRLCQLKSLIMPVFLFTSCTFLGKKNETHTHEMISIFRPTWFVRNSEHSLVGQDNNPKAHMFFDVDPEFSKDYRFVNAIITIPQNSPHHYKLDMVSGQRYYSHSYCEQGDIWAEESGSFSRPFFSVGHIPRVLDQMGDPQKIIVFKDRTKDLKSPDLFDYRVKLIGAFVEQLCLEGSCLGKTNWLSRLVLVGVDEEDKLFSKVKTLSDLRQLIPWNDVKAILANMEGRNFSGITSSPYLKIGNLISYEEALPYLKKRSIFFSGEELKKIQAGCHRLYDRFWEEVGEFRAEDRGAKNEKELIGKINLQNDLRAKKLPVGFAERFKKFGKKYHDELNTCSKMVYAGNLNQNAEKFWFFKYAQIFFTLNKEGYFFDCKKRSWQKNIINDFGGLAYNFKKDMANCGERELDLAMSYLPNLLSGLKNSSFTYRFIDYDNHAYGTHNKMYSWVKIPVKKFDCTSDINERALRETRVLPEDIKWNERRIEDIESKLKVIR